GHLRPGARPHRAMGPPAAGRWAAGNLTGGIRRARSPARAERPRAATLLRLIAGRKTAAARTRANWARRLEGPGGLVPPRVPSRARAPPLGRVLVPARPDRRPRTRPCPPRPTWAAQARTRQAGPVRYCPRPFTPALHP